MHLKRRERGGAEETPERKLKSLTAFDQQKRKSFPPLWLNFSAFSLLPCDLCVLNGVTRQFKWWSYSKPFSDKK